VGKPERKRKIRRPRSRWTILKLRELVWDGLDWIDLAQDRDKLMALANTVMNLRVPRHNRSLWSRCKGQEGPPLIHSFIHSSGLHKMLGSS
jgi:hypothetical protein